MKFYKKMAKNQAFTLIELLIVVLIIAILAAIAVPNFLEFQTRAKVSRVYAEMRTLATAIEAYTVDNNVPPLGENSWTQFAGTPAPPAPPTGYSPQAWYSLYGMSFLTTPISYITTIPPDPFNLERQSGSSLTTVYGYNDFVYEGLGPHNTSPYRFHQYYWALQSWGPARVNQDPTFLIRMLRGTTNSGDIGVYDPTNGTTSLGAIVRTNKGIFTGSPGN